MGGEGSRAQSARSAVPESELLLLFVVRNCSVTPHVTTCDPFVTPQTAIWINIHAVCDGVTGFSPGFSPPQGGGGRYKRQRIVLVLGPFRTSADIAGPIARRPRVRLEQLSALFLSYSVLFCVIW